MKIGTALLLSEKYEEAVSNYTLLLQLSEDNSQAHLMKGVAMTKLKIYDKAIEGKRFLFYKLI